jgi:hypothetical protein
MPTLDKKVFNSLEIEEPSDKTSSGLTSESKSSIWLTISYG